MTTDIATVEERVDRLSKAGSVEIGATLGGVRVMSIADLEVISTRLARGQIAVPAHCRDNPGTVFALCLQALEWGIPIMSVINKSYVPKNGDRIGYESQLIHAVIEKNAPLKSRLRYEIIGEGDERRCKVWGTFKGETEPHTYTSETLGKLHPGHITKDNKRYVTGSQLWDDAPEVQMFYSASRQWARLFCPDVLLGAYAPEELEAAPPIDVTPPQSFADRLKAAAEARGKEQRGFNADHIERTTREHTNNKIIEGHAEGGANEAESEYGEEEATDGDNENDVRALGGGSARGEDGGHDQDAGAVAGGSGSAPEDGAASAGGEAAQQGEIFPPDRDKPKGRKRS